MRKCNVGDRIAFTAIGLDKEKKFGEVIGFTRERKIAIVECEQILNNKREKVRYLAEQRSISKI